MCHLWFSYEGADGVWAVQWALTYNNNIFKQLVLPNVMHYFASEVGRLPSEGWWRSRSCNDWLHLSLLSFQELKKPVITSALSSLVKHIILPAVGVPASRQYEVEVNEISWSTEFRNATGVLRYSKSSCTQVSTKHIHGDALYPGSVVPTNAVYIYFQYMWTSKYYICCTCDAAYI